MILAFMVMVIQERNITENSLLAPDAGTVTCTVTVDGVNFTSDPLTLRVSGEQL